MSRRGYGSSLYSGRRPRTKVYDCNYAAGEGYYRSALDGLDRKRLGLPSENVPAPPAESTPPPRERPRSMAADLEWESRPTAASIAAEMAEEDDFLTRIRTARRSQQEIAEKSLDSVMTLRSEQTDRRYAKMLDSVGLTGEESSVRSSRRPAPIMDDPVWPALAEGSDSSAASARARATRARLADLEAEMTAVADRGVARQRRAAALRQLLADEESSSIKITETISSEKRLASAAGI